MNIEIRYSNGSRESANIPEDIEILSFVVGGYPRSMPYRDGHVLAYSETANRKKPNVKYKGKQFYGAIALMRKEEYENVIHG